MADQGTPACRRAGEVDRRGGPVDGHADVLGAGMRGKRGDGRRGGAALDLQPYRLRVGQQRRDQVGRQRRRRGPGRHEDRVGHQHLPGRVEEVQVLRLVDLGEVGLGEDPVRRRVGDTPLLALLHQGELLFGGLRAVAALLRPDVLAGPVERRLDRARHVDHGPFPVVADGGVAVHVDLVDHRDRPGRSPAPGNRPGQVLLGDSRVGGIADGRVQEPGHDVGRAPAGLRSGRDRPDEVGILRGVLRGRAERAGRAAVRHAHAAGHGGGHGGQHARPPAPRSRASHARSPG